MRKLALFIAFTSTFVVSYLSISSAEEDWEELLYKGIAIISIIAGGIIMYGMKSEN